MSGKVSMRKGDNTKKAPKHKNSYAYKHNKNSRLTKEILALPNYGLCNHCHEVIEWRKKYRKYKPLTVPKKCIKCGEKGVKAAYHEICDPCSNSLKVCAKCGLAKELVPKTTTTPQEANDEQNKLRNMLKALTERERRSFLRSLDKKKDAAAEAGVDAPTMAEVEQMVKDFGNRKAGDDDDFGDLDDLDDSGDEMDGDDLDGGEGGQEASGAADANADGQSGDDLEDEDEDEDKEEEEEEEEREES